MVKNGIRIVLGFGFGFWLFWKFWSLLLQTNFLLQHYSYAIYGKDALTPHLHMSLVW